MDVRDDQPEQMVPPQSGESQPADSAGRLRHLEWNERTELLSVILLSLASLAAAWSGYQASQWSGRQSEFFSQAGAYRIDATHTLTVAYVNAVGDSDLFNSWVEAYAAGDDARIQFYRGRFSDELEVAMVAWLATDPLNNPDAPSSPMAVPEYRLDEMVAAEQLEQEANDRFVRGQEANERSDAYVLDTVIFAAVLFFGGLASKVTWYQARNLAIGMSAALLIFGVIRILTLPVA